MVFNGNTSSALLLNELKQRVQILSFVPEFSDILVGNDGPSARYVRMKEKVAKEIGINFVSAELLGDVTTEDILEKIAELSSRPNMCGIIVQLPLPAHIDTARVLDAVPLVLDVDGLSQAYTDLFYATDSFDGMLLMPTVGAVNKILNQALYNNPTVTHIAVVGQGRLVGLPITHLLESQSKSLDLGWEIKTVDIHTPYPSRDYVLKEADIVITAVGSPGIITGDQLKDGVIVIDAGTLEVGHVLLGDTDFKSVVEKSSFITPTPGGVGPMTVACLMENVVITAEKKQYE